MKRQLLSIYSLFLFLGLSLGISSCAEDNPVATGDRPTINSFTASPTTIEIGSATTLTWSVDDADSITISEIGGVTGTAIQVFPAQTTTYTLTATNVDGSSTETVTVTVDNPSDAGAPNNPSALIATPGNPGIISLNWTGSTGASTYVVERRSSVGGFSLINTTNINSYTDVGLFPGIEYTYRVRAVNGAGARSGWSNFARAIATGTAPVIARVEITPANPPTLQPGGSATLTARAYDNSGNDLGLSQSIFTWNSSNVAIAPVNQLGFVSIPMTAQQGSAQITAAVGGITSLPVTINVQLQKATTLVIYHPTGMNNESFAVYTSALAGVTFDVLNDRQGHSDPTLISLDQIEGYERVFYISHHDYPLHATTKSLLSLYAKMPNKRLIVMSNSSAFSGDPAFLNLAGLESESYRASNSVNSTFVGGTSTVMEGFSFEQVTDFGYVSTLELKAGGAGKAAFTTTDLSSGNTVITAVQADVGTSSKLFYASFVLENVQQNLRDEFMAKLMGL